MLKIAICDDNQCDLRILDDSVSKWLRQQGIKGQVYKFNHSMELIEVMESTVFDLFILDIVMPEVNGINVGRKIREMNNKAGIIYLTTTPEYALDAFGVHALRYLSKPLKMAELNDALEFASNFLTTKKHTIAIKSTEGIKKVFIEDIMYIENNLRKMIYHLANDEKLMAVRRNGSFENAAAPVSSNIDFCQPHKSYFVNMGYIQTINANQILMDNNCMIPITRQRLNEVKKQYLKYISRYGGEDL